MESRSCMPATAKKRCEVDAKAKLALELRTRGMSFAAIGASMDPPITSGHLIEILRRRNLTVPALPDRKCALVECGVVFSPRRPNQTYCCRLHSKRNDSRVYFGMTAEICLCRLPECREAVVYAKTSKREVRFCSKTHRQRHAHRVRSGYYDRLVDKLTCAVCDFWGPVELHHILPRSKGGADTQDNLMPLCSNHHQMLHCGLAEILDGTYIDLREKMREAELSRRVVYNKATKGIS